MWVRVREEFSKGNTEVGICKRASVRMKQIIFRQLAEVSTDPASERETISSLITC